MIDDYSIGDDVIVTLPGGESRGEVAEILCRYSFGEETRYRVKGKDFETITSARTMRRNGSLFW